MTKLLMESRLKGNAFKWLHSRPEHIAMSVEELLSNLCEMFCHPENALEMRRRFEARVWKKEESFSEYLHRKVILGNRTPRLGQRKTSGYQRRCENVKQDKKEVPNNELRCYNCGDKNHLGVNYPVKNKGPRCFACREFGHRAHIKNDNVKQELEDIIYNYEPKAIKESNIKLEIVLKDDIPTYQPLCRLAPVQREIVNKQIDEWMRAGIVRENTSEYGSPISVKNAIQQKRHSRTRLCVDYRLLNKKICKDRYPLSFIEDQLDRLQGATIFSTLDLKDGFFHVAIEENSQQFPGPKRKSLQQKWQRIVVKDHNDIGVLVANALPRRHSSSVCVGLPWKHSTE
nr:PREDICTED: uncharacterized protein LOC105663193 [Megachile rotundata]